MTLEILVLAWDRQRNREGFNLLMESHPPLMIIEPQTSIHIKKNLIVFASTLKYHILSQSINDDINMVSTIAGSVHRRLCRVKNMLAMYLKYHKAGLLMDT